MCQQCWQLGVNCESLSLQVSWFVHILSGKGVNLCFFLCCGLFLSEKGDLGEYIILNETLIRLRWEGAPHTRLTGHFPSNGIRGYLIFGPSYLA